MSIKEVFEKQDGIGMAALVAKGEVHPLELLDEAISRIEQSKNTINCVVFPDFDAARKRAKSGLPAGSFSGIPLLLKDLTLQRVGTTTSNATKALSNFKVLQNSLIIDKLEQAGFNYLAMTAVPELGYCIISASRFYGPTRNAWNLQHSSGGSSGGAGAAVGARIMPLAHASDGAGSIRIPASFNGLVGLKMSRGRTSYSPHYGDIWYGAALEGCVSLSIRDTAAYCDVISGTVAGDPYEQMGLLPGLAQALNRPTAKLKIGLVTTAHESARLSSEVSTAVAGAGALLADMGHEVIPYKFRFDIEKLLENFGNMAAVTLAAAMGAVEKATGIKLGSSDFSRVNWEQIEYGRRISAAQHAEDIDEMRILGRNVATDCQGFDVLVMPTLPRTAPRIDDKALDMYSLSRDKYHEGLLPYLTFTAPFNYSGQPALSLPLAMSTDGLPIGVQFVAAHGRDGLLLQLGRDLEQARPWRQNRPPHAVS